MGGGIGFPWESTLRVNGVLQMGPQAPSADRETASQSKFFDPSIHLIPLIGVIESRFRSFAPPLEMSLRLAPVMHIYVPHPLIRPQAR